MSDIEDLSNVHIFPDDFGRMSESETHAICYSLPMGSPDKGETLPLFTQEQAKQLAEDSLRTQLAASEARVAELREALEVTSIEPWYWASTGSGPKKRCCRSCGAVSETNEWRSPIPHFEVCRYRKNQELLASTGGSEHE